MQGATARDALGHVLAPAVEAVRTALQRRRPDDVPHRLRRVVAASGRRLPPPLLATLFDHLEEDDELRQEAAELIEGPEAALAYLTRAPGWWQTVSAAVEEIAHDRAAADRAAMERRLVEASSEIEETRRRLAETQDDLRRAEAEVARVREEHAGKVAAARERDAERIRELTTDLAATETELGSRNAEIEELHRDVDALRRRTSRGASTPGPSRDSRGFGGDPLQSARMLDLQLGMLQRRWGGGFRDEPLERRPVVLEAPPGLRATDAGWFSWLANTETPCWLIVDGHNVVFSISADRSRMADSMRRLEAALRRLVFVARARVRITLVYDSSLEEDHLPLLSERGFVVRFAPPHLTADDEIVALAGAADPYEEAVVVVTSDRELQRRVGDAGIVVAGTALAAHVTSG